MKRNSGRFKRIGRAASADHHFGLHQSSGQSIRAGPALVRLSMPLWPRKQPLAALPRSDAATTINNNLRGARPTNSRSILL